MRNNGNSRHGLQLGKTKTALNFHNFQYFRQNRAMKTETTTAEPSAHLPPPFDLDRAPKWEDLPQWDNLPTWTAEQLANAPWMIHPETETTTAPLGTD